MTSSPGSFSFANVPSSLTTLAVIPGIRTPAHPGVGGMTSFGERATVVNVSVKPSDNQHFDVAVRSGGNIPYPCSATQSGSNWLTCAVNSADSGAAPHIIHFTELRSYFLVRGL